MRKILSLTTCFAALACGTAYAQNAPVRNTLQSVGGAIDRTTDAAANAVRGAAAMTDRAAQAAVRGANVQGTQRTTQGFGNAGFGNAIAPQANVGNGYSNRYVQGQPMGQTWHQTAGSSLSANVYTLHTDHNGREFICLAGQRAYVDNPNASGTSQQTSPQSADEPYRAAYGSYESESENAATTSEQGQDTDADVDDASVDTNADADTSNADADTSNADADTSNTDADTSTDDKERDTSDLDLSAEVDAEANSEVAE